MNTVERAYDSWRKIELFKNDARGLFKGKNLYELNNILCRFLLSSINDIQSAKDKAITELIEKNIDVSAINFDLLVAESTINTSCKNKYKIRTSTNRKNNLVISYGDFRYELLRSKYDEFKHIDIKDITMMLMRYDSIQCDNGQFWGMPAATWRLLINKYGADYECFACPLNNNLCRFFSVFAEDDIFGGQGSFFDAILGPGVYVANPPYIETLMMRMVNKILGVLESTDISKSSESTDISKSSESASISKLACSSESNTNITFFMLLPNWADAESIVTITNCKWFRGRIVLKKGHRIRNYINDSIISANFMNIVVCVSNADISVDWDQIRATF